MVKMHLSIYTEEPQYGQLEPALAWEQLDGC